MQRVAKISRKPRICEQGLDLVADPTARSRVLGKNSKEPITPDSKSKIRARYELFSKIEPIRRNN